MRASGARLARRAGAVVCRRASSVAGSGGSVLALRACGARLARRAGAVISRGTSSVAGVAGGELAVRSNACCRVGAAFAGPVRVFGDGRRVKKPKASLSLEECLELCVQRCQVFIARGCNITVVANKCVGAYCAVHRSNHCWTIRGGDPHVSTVVSIFSKIVIILDVDLL